MKKVSLENVNTEEVVKVLKNGGLVVYPTETVYGVGADATNEDAIKKLNKFKKRPYGKPYSIAVTDEAMAGKYVHINDTANNLYKNFLPGPMTIVSKGKGRVAKGVESEDGTLGIRIPDYSLVADIVKAFGRPITATSANASFKPRPYKISDIFKYVNDDQKKLIDFVIDAGVLPKNDPSTVIDTTGDDKVVLRQGDIKISKENEVLTRSPEQTQNTAKEIWQKYQGHHKKRAILFALKGEMGTGKTVFTKGLAKAMGIKDKVTSPTYNIEQIYGNGKLLHADVWKIQNKEGLENLDFESYIKRGSVLAIEWADKITDVVRSFSEDAVVVWVEILYGKNADDRMVRWGVEREHLITTRY